MCTLIMISNQQGDGSLALGLNRDELHERPAADFSLWTDEKSGQKWVGGRDKKSGGSWFAIGENMIAAVTNHRGQALSIAGSRSRGELVVQCALLGDVSRLDGLLSSYRSDEFGPFHLLVIGFNKAKAVTNRKGHFEVVDVPSGRHVLGNKGLDEGSDPVVKNVHRQLDARIEGGEHGNAVPALQNILSLHGDGFPCVHLGPFGTTSAAVYLREKGEETLLTTQGASCETPWQDTAPLLRQLRAPSGDHH